MSTRAWILVVAVVLALAGALLVNKYKEATYPTDVIEEASNPLELLNKATLVVPDTNTTVTLVDGAAQFVVGSEGSSPGSIVLQDGLFVEWKGESRSDIAAVVAVNTGGTGVFLYLVLFDASGNTLTQKSFEFLGDRIGVTSIGVGELVHGAADYRITVETLVRKEGEAYAAVPTVEQTRTFYVTDQVLEEVDVGSDDT